jgi:3',5'-cyclic AMP phosphodiesterase CpdA
MSQRRSVPDSYAARRADRRRWLQTAGLSAAVAWAGGEALAASETKKRSLRLAHLTDIHVQPELGADMGMAACLRHVQAQSDRPDLILTGGDSVMESFAQDAARTQLQWDVWRKVLRSECSLPVESCIGNHDVWGWNKAKSGATGKEARFGKQWAVEALGLPQRYRSFDRAGWHFVVLDSTHTGKNADEYTAKLDEEQFAWLAQDLAKTPPSTPILVLSHIPILSAAAFLDGENSKSGDWLVPGAWMHVDCQRIIQLFLKHPSVKLCLSGHLHLVDRVDYNGVTYLCNGAVCGGWWKGDNQQCDEGYGLVDLYSDGSFDHRYVGYGWQPKS